ncbi:glycoside hydrolase family 13 protein [Salisaeta longa]|uniref:glycoside hydrolase family 13 protein n=1 Tax=Salisaeta longa TaxID=503170 RepID=UPI0003B47F4E|nr:glycoside hydrolase family 13 protein [Salisaeta longa]
MSFETPSWVHDAVFYQIFPDRFARSGRVAEQQGLALKPWGAPPEEQGFQGGDLYGVVDRLDYIEALGVTALYLNPIFASAANHRYHTYDYYRVDPLLGGNDALRALLDAAHARDIRVVLDGVFNHASRGFWAFHHILENGRTSPYLDWFIIHDWPLRPYAPDPETPHNYDAWYDIPALPEFNTDNPEVQDFLLDVAQHWIDFGIDGWRLDVPNEIDDDAFWRTFRERVKTANPEAYIVGEIWGHAGHWLQGDQFDAVMNYPLMDAILSYAARSMRDFSHDQLPLETAAAPATAARFEALMHRYDPAVTHAQLNLIDSHDTPRARWLLDDDPAAQRLAVLLQMTLPGAPCIYYGDEIGLSAAGDPHCRGAFPWDAPEHWDDALLDFYKSATALRHEYPALRTGTFEGVAATGDLLVFRRTLDDEAVLCAFNAGEEPMALPDDVAPERAALTPVGPFASEDARRAADVVPPRSAHIYAPVSAAVYS